MRFSAAISLILLAAFLGGNYSQKLSLGSCGELRSLELQLDQLVDTWREQVRTPSILNHQWRCVTYRITAITASVQYSVMIDGIEKGTWRASRLTGTFDIAGTTTASTTLPVTSTLSLNMYWRFFQVSLKYYVVGTDSTTAPTYLVLYSCENFNPFGKLESALILSKAALTPVQYAAALSSLSAVGYDVDKLERTFSGGCLE